MCKITIVVPVYNVEKYLKTCVKSILNQTFKDFELIIVNDGSTDSSGLIGYKLTETDKRIKYIEQSNQGVGGARNSGMNMAKGKYICFVDPDDTIEAQMCETLLNLAQKYDAQIAICNINQIRNNNSQITRHDLPINRTINREEIKNKIITSYFTDKDKGLYSACNKLYDLNFINSLQLRFNKKPRAEDWWFNLELYQKTDRIIACDQALYNYIRQNDNSIMASYRANQFELSLLSREKLKQIRKEYNLQVNLDVFNQVFIYNTIEFIFQVIKNEKTPKKIIFDIFSNKEYNDAIIHCFSMPKHIMLINKCINLKMYNIAYLLFWLWSKK